MRRYVENVPPSLTQKELHDRAYALLYRVLKDEWGIASPIVEKTPLGKPYLKGDLYYFGIIFFFAIGAGGGGNLSMRLGIPAIWVSDVLLLISFILMFSSKHRD